MKFSRLRLSGFKSFVDPTELHIEPGLTGVVGPNGCGKSNLLEAMRWVMGENRPTSMRGSGMDDVIFGGTGSRPMRNHAEVTLVVDNSDRSAPAPYNEIEVIEITRRIEREAGSLYRINGREVRQRDVQIFFADASTGSTSPALVRQGQICDPDQPEAAGAARDPRGGRGHLRSASAPSRGRAATEGGGDQSGAADRRHRRGRHAASGLAPPGAPGLALSQPVGTYPQGRGDVVPAALARSRGDRAQRRGSAGAGLRDGCRPHAARGRRPRPSRPRRRPHCRRCATRRRRSPQRFSGCCTNATVSTRKKRAPAKRRSGSGSASDRPSRTSSHERALEQDAGSSLADLESEFAELTQANLNASEALAGAEQRARALMETLAERERTLERLTSEFAHLNATRASYERAIGEGEDQARRAAHQARRIASARRSRASSDAARHRSDRGAHRNRARSGGFCAEPSGFCWKSVQRETAQAEAAARAPLDAAEQETRRLTAEARALANLLRPGDSDLWPPLIDSLKVQPGYEAALAAALGDELNAPLDEAAPHHWRHLGELEFAADAAGGRRARDFRGRTASARPAARADRRGERRGRKAVPEGLAARPAPGVAARRCVALGRLHGIGGCAEPGRGAARTAQSAGVAGGTGQSGEALTRSGPRRPCGGAGRTRGGDRGRARRDRANCASARTSCWRLKATRRWRRARSPNATQRLATHRGRDQEPGSGRRECAPHRSVRGRSA